jgi:amino acid permease
MVSNTKNIFKTILRGSRSNLVSAIISAPGAFCGGALITNVLISLQVPNIITNGDVLYELDGVTPLIINRAKYIIKLTSETQIYYITVGELSEVFIEELCV